MKYLPLVWSGLWRKPARAVLTLSSIAVAFTLYGSLHGITASMDAAVEGINANRVRVQSTGSRAEALPISHFQAIAKIPNIRNVTSVTFFSSYFQHRRQGVGGVALGGDVRLGDSGDIIISEEEIAAWNATRTGAVVGAELAQRFGWKVGDRIVLTSAWVKKDGSKSWPVDIVGIFQVPEKSDLGSDLWLHYEYLDEGRRSLNGTVNSFVVRTTDPEHNAQVAADIDALFANSSHPTLTQSDREWARATMDQAGDVNLMVNAVVGASLFTILFLTGNTLMQSVRQRRPEMAVLKTVGYKNGTVLLLVLAEAFALYLVGAGAGLSIATMLFPLLGEAVGESLFIPLPVIALGLMIAMVAALLSSALPAIWAGRMSVAEGLSRR